MLFSTALLGKESALFVFLGLATGSLYALVALGVVIVHRASGVLNFSASGVGAVGAFLFFNLRDGGMNWMLALSLSLLLGAVLGLVAAAILRSLGGTSLLVKTISTLAFALGAQGFIGIVWPPTGTGAIPLGILPTTRVTLPGSVVITEDRLILILAVIAVAVVLKLIYSKTLFGLATSGVSESRRVAATSGWSPTVIESASFVVGSLLSTFAAIMLAPIEGLDPTVLYLAIIPALAAALLGKFNSFGLAVIGALVIGIFQAELLLFEPNIANGLGIQQATLGGLPDLVPLLIVVIVAAAGKSRLSRGDLLTRLPNPGTGAVRIVPLMVFVAAGALFFVESPVTWDSAMVTTLATAIVLFSIVVVTGYAGQLSLCQFGLAGFGGWVAGRFVAEFGLPFIWAMLLGIAITVPLGMVVAASAVRTRGINLAIATLGLALMINSLIFQNGSLTGGTAGTLVGQIHLFGINLDPNTLPKHYGIFVLALVVISGLMVANLRRSRSGRRLIAVRSDERAAAALGIGVVPSKLYTFGVGAGIAAIGGIALSFRTTSIVFTNFDAPGSIDIVLYTVVGGVGWVTGGLAGATLVAGGIGAMITTSIVGGIANISSWLLIFTGVQLILVLRESPDGIAALTARQIAFVARRLPKLPVRLPRIESGTRLDSSTGSGRQRASSPVEVRGLTMRFGGVVALDGVDFEVHPGEVVGLIGPNGAGKTTALDVLTGFTKQTQGEILLDGQVVNSWSPERRSRAGMARSWQSVQLFQEMTVRENLVVAAEHHRFSHYFTDLVRPGHAIRTAVIDEVVAQFDLGSCLDMYPPNISHGTARLVGIARAMVAEPTVLFLDEPAAGLSMEERVRLRMAIRQIAESKGIGVLLVEHDVDLILGTCDRIVVLDFGYKIAEGTPSEIATNPEVVRAYLGEDPDAVSQAISTRDTGTVATLPVEG